MIVGYGFEQLGLHRISLEVYSFNPRARHVYDKVGFVAEGVLRDALRWEDRWIDAIVMSMLAPECSRTVVTEDLGGRAGYEPRPRPRVARRSSWSSIQTVWQESALAWSTHARSPRSTLARAAE